MINNIKSHPIASKYLCSECEENGFSTNIDPSIPLEKYVIIKVDNYYNSLNIEKRPASPDCLIVLECTNNEYKIYIIELKNIKDQSGFAPVNIREKFETCVYDFMSNIYRDVFYDTSFKFKSIKPFFVTDPYDLRSNPDKNSKIKNTRIDALLAMNTKAILFDNKKLSIEHSYISPTIKPC